MDLDVKLNIDKLINRVKAKSSKKPNKTNNELAQDILGWVSGGKNHYDGEIFSKWSKI